MINKLIRHPRKKHQSIFPGYISAVSIPRLVPPSTMTPRFRFTKLHPVQVPPNFLLTVFRANKRLSVSSQYIWTLCLVLAVALLLQLLVHVVPALNLFPVAVSIGPSSAGFSVFMPWWTFNLLRGRFARFARFFTRPCAIVCARSLVP